MALSVRTRFGVFKRDDFRCQYCGRCSPEVVLEVDHIVPLCEGGQDDPINLRTSCWECNHGKGPVPLETIITGEDPHDRAVMVLERERQLREYNAVLAVERVHREADTWELVRYWKSEQGYSGEELAKIDQFDYRWLFNALAWCPKELIRNFMDQALGKGHTRNLKYVGGCVRNWRNERAVGEPLEPVGL